jgi:hypothetical protein
MRVPLLHRVSVLTTHSAKIVFSYLIEGTGTGIEGITIPKAYPPKLHTGYGTGSLYPYVHDASFLVCSLPVPGIR